MGSRPRARDGVSGESQVKEAVTRGESGQVWPVSGATQLPGLIAQSRALETYVRRLASPRRPLAYRPDLFVIAGARPLIQAGL
ncbi:hypothetical protein ElyMa_005695400 [Elysia marginata]|uniref:Uncharacterized protein n=1 Tax=Elysia marginata TaxID=1093978 RepID=A0AAV4FGG3_9GAST|nr:hypothetical protein ElyMa_005695400 [Elysia marginata]